MLTRERLIYIGVGLTAALLVSLSCGAGLFAGPQSAIEDTLFSPRPISPEIVIVAIDDRSLAQIGQWPWPRATYAQLLEALATYNPQAVGIDVLFSEPSRFPNDDATFARALANAPFPIVLAGQAESLEIINGSARATNLIEPLPVFQESVEGIGLVNVIADRDGIVRRFAEPVTSASGNEYRSFASAVLEAAKSALTREIAGTPRIVYAGPPKSVRYISAADLLEPTRISNLERKFVFVGITAESLHDSQKTPVSGGTSMQGVEIHAQIANMLLMEYELTPLPRNTTILWIVFASLLSTAVLLFIKRFEFAIAVIAAIGIGYFIFGIVLFEKGLVVNLVHITLAWLLPTIALSLYRFFSSEKERRVIRQTFSKYVAPDVLNELLAHPELITLGGEEREITVLFSDIRGFTTLSEQTTPIELVRILNTYFSAVTKCVIAHGGVLDKYIGDAVMAFWGAPMNSPLQADRAVETALDMIQAVDELNQQFKANGDPEIKTGIGIYTGRAVVGNIGSEHRFDYTAIGDAVNAASRIEGLTKDYGVRILIGESTKNKLKGQFSLTSLGESSVKGRAEQVTIYAVEK
jgi:adenylate cyclase